MDGAITSLGARGRQQRPLKLCRPGPPGSGCGTHRHHGCRQLRRRRRGRPRARGDVDPGNESRVNESLQPAKLGNGLDQETLQVYTRADHLQALARRAVRSCRAERRRARRATAGVPPAPRCLPNAARRGGGLFAHAEACGFGHRSRHRTPISGSIKVRVLTRAKGRCECCGAGCCLATPSPKGPGGGPHRAQEPRRLGRPQQPADPQLPLQCRPAMGGARRDVYFARWSPVTGCCWRTNWRCASPMLIR